MFVMGGEGIHSHIILRKRELAGWLANYYYVFGGFRWWWCDRRGRLDGGWRTSDQEIRWLLSSKLICRCNVVINSSWFLNTTTVLLLMLEGRV